MTWRICAVLIIIIIIVPITSNSSSSTIMSNKLTCSYCIPPHPSLRYRVNKAQLIRWTETTKSAYMWLFLQPQLFCIPAVCITTVISYDIHCWKPGSCATCASHCKGAPLSQNLSPFCYVRGPPSCMYLQKAIGRDIWYRTYPITETSN
jgi:hypothetical protein